MSHPAYKGPHAQTPAKPEENPARPTDPGAPVPTTPGKKDTPPEPDKEEKESDSGPSSPDEDIPELNPDPVPGQDPVRPMMQNLC